MSNKDLNTSYSKCSNCKCHSPEVKNEGCNEWDSVPKTYDAAESCHKHEKTAGNNQWCSTHK